jgi:hypothetical protein
VRCQRQGPVQVPVRCSAGDSTAGASATVKVPVQVPVQVTVQVQCRCQCGTLSAWKPVPQPETLYCDPPRGWATAARRKLHKTDSIALLYEFFEIHGV